MDFKDLKELVANAGSEPDLKSALELIPALSLLSKTPQDPVHHGEGDVWTHTKMVVQSLIESEAYEAASEDDRFVLYMSALLHDISKSSTTVIDEITDPVTGILKTKISQPGHSGKGAVDSRILLWRAGVPFELREAISRIIAVHQIPFFAIRGDRSGRTPEFLARRISWEVPVWMLCAVAAADINGRISPDKQKVLDDIEVFRMLAEEDGCLSEKAQFADEYTRLCYFRGANILPQYAHFREKKGSEVIVMSGPPASGKNTWVEHHAKGLPVVSFDDARDELGLAHGKNEGMVAHHAFDMAKALLRRGDPFVWNATHLSTQMRSKTLDLLHDYHADTRLVYLEQPENVLLSRNSKRDSSLNNKNLLKMLFKWEVPMPWEAGKVEYVTAGSSKKNVV